MNENVCRKKAFVAPTPSVRELSKSSHKYDRTEPQFFSSFVLASGVAGYRLGLGIYRRAHSFLLARHFIRTGSWLSLRLARGRYRINVSLITYPAAATPPFSSIGVPPLPTLATSLLLHRPVTSTDCLPTAPPTPLFLSPARSLSLVSLVLPRHPSIALLPSLRRLLLLLLLLLWHVMAPRVKETNVYLKN